MYIYYIYIYICIHTYTYTYIHIHTHTYTGIFVVCLLAFALLASGYVLSVTWNDPKRNKAKLLLNCSMIVASVVPPGMHTPAYVSIRQHTSAYVSI